MRKVLIPKKDYVKELIKIIRVTKDEQKLRNLLSDYHEKDIAEAITFLTVSYTHLTLPTNSLV